KFVVLSPLALRKRQSRATPSEAKLTIRCESRLRPELLAVMRTSNHSKCRMSPKKSIGFQPAWFVFFLCPFII
ncbi:hypothetical protein, partial [Hallella sp.]|uniref:hypothetical protein n=1 Tax=Hallella sp. TaxID=2980186 RepID=UPI00307AEF30